MGSRPVPPPYTPPLPPLATDLHVSSPLAVQRVIGGDSTRSQVKTTENCFETAYKIHPYLSLQKVVVPPGRFSFETVSVPHAVSARFSLSTVGSVNIFSRVERFQVRIELSIRCKSLDFNHYK